MSYRFPAVVTSPAVVVGRLARLLASVIGVVVVVTIVGCWLPMLGFFLFLFGLVAFPLSILSIGAAGTVRVIRNRELTASSRKRFGMVVAAPSLAILELAALLPACWLGSFLGDESFLLFYRNHYLEIIKKVKYAPLPVPGSGAWQWDGHVTFIADYSYPRRVAFEPSGFLDNWSGIVWDLTHEVLQARGFDAKSGRFYAPDRVTKLFGGDLVQCRRLRGDWFDCSFT